MRKPRGLKCGRLRLPTLSPWSRSIEITLNLNNFSISEGIPTWRLLSFLWESLLLQFLCRYCGKISHPWGAVLLRFRATPGVSPWVSVSNNDTDVISLEAINPLTWTAFATSPWKNWRCVWKKILGRKWRRWGTGFSRKFQAGAKLLLRGSCGTWSLAPATMIEVLPFGRWCLRQLQGGRAGTATSTEALTIKEKKLRYNQLSLRSRPFDFWGGLWVISEKKSSRLIWQGQKSCKEIREIQERITAYNTGENLTPLYVGEKIQILLSPYHSYTPAKVKRSSPLLTSRKYELLLGWDIQSSLPSLQSFYLTLSDKADTLAKTDT